MSCQDGDAPPTSDIKGEPWPDHDMKFFGKIKKEISKAVKMTRFKDGVKFEGEMPLKYCGVISPSDNPVRWFGTKTAMTMISFAIPMFWFGIRKHSGRPCNPVPDYLAGGTVQ